MPFLRSLTTVLPPSVRRHMNRQMWRQMDLVAHMGYGFQLPLRSRMDWDTFNELFVKGEYDPALRRVFEAAGPEDGRPIVCLDLGANIGLFALRWVSMAQTYGIGPDRLQLVSVEGNRTNHGRLVELEKSWQRDWPGFRVVRGLAGRRSGSAVLYDADMHVTVSTRGRGHGEEVPFIDVESLLPPDQPVSLIKCDIEGSEQDFMEAYPQLLRRTGHLVIEFHHEMVDVEACRRLLSQAGLHHVATLSDGMFTHSDVPARRTTELFSRHR